MQINQIGKKKTQFRAIRFTCRDKYTTQQQILKKQKLKLMVNPF